MGDSWQEIVKREAERRAQEAAARGQHRPAAATSPGGQAVGPNQAKGAPVGKKRPGPGKRWPLREWMGRETWAILSSSTQAVFAWLCVKTDPRTGYWGHGYGPIGRACGISTDTVGRAVAQLQDNRLVKVQTQVMPCRGQPRTRVMIWILSPGEDFDLNRVDARLSGMGPEPQPCGPVGGAGAAVATGGQPCGTA